MAKSKKNFVEKRSKYLIIAAIAIIAVIGVSYAWFTQVLTGEKKATLTAGELKLVLDEGENTISVSPAVPMSNADGEATDPYTFTLTNSGNVTSVYTIYLDDDAVSGDRISDSLIKYNIEKDGQPGTSALLTAMGDRIIDSGTIAPGASQEYALRLWIDETATTAISGQEFAAKIRIDASQTGIPEGTNVDYSTGQTIPQDGE